MVLLRSSISLGQILTRCTNIHSIALTSSTVQEDIGCNNVSLHKLELGDSLSLGFPGNNIGIQTAVLPWQLLVMGFGLVVIPWH